MVLNFFTSQWYLTSHFSSWFTWFHEFLWIWLKGSLGLLAIINFIPWTIWFSTNLVTLSSDPYIFLEPSCKNRIITQFSPCMIYVNSNSKIKCNYHSTLAMDVLYATHHIAFIRVWSQQLGLNTQYLAQSSGSRTWYDSWALHPDTVTLCVWLPMQLLGLTK